MSLFYGFIWFNNTLKLKGDDIMREVTSEDVITSLKGVSYPTTKKEMVEQAKKNHASDDIVHAIENLPREEFRTTVDIATLFEDKSRRR